MTELSKVEPFWFGEAVRSNSEIDKRQADTIIKNYFDHLYEKLLADCLSITQEDKKTVDVLDEGEALDLGERLNIHISPLQNFQLWFALSQEKVLGPNRKNLLDKEIETMLAKHRFQNAKYAEAYFKIQLARTALERGWVENLFYSYDNYFHKWLGSLGHALIED